MYLSDNNNTSTYCMLNSPPYACPGGGLCKASGDLFLLMLQKYHLNRACTEYSLKLEMSERC